MAFEVQSTTEQLESVAGLALAGEIARASGLAASAGNRRSFANTLSVMFGLLVQGRSSYVDIDVSTLDNSGSHKEGVSRTYMGTDGYAPIFSYIGAEGYMLDC
jgi:hypothetical protein